MSNLAFILVCIAWLAVVVAFLYSLSRLLAREKSRDRWRLATDQLNRQAASTASSRFLDASQRTVLVDRPVSGWHAWLRTVLRRAGFTHPQAVFWLISSCVASALLGLAAAVAFRVTGLQQSVLDGVESVPGGLSSLIVPVVLVSPWLIAVILAAIPILLVRARRRKRIQQVSRDLPLALDLWATLAEGGQAFDASLQHWLETQPPDRPLAAEAMRYQRDLLGGMRRTEALRRFATRLDIPSVTRFVGAMIQSDQMGSSVSETLRLQAEDVRAQRRERSMAFAQSLATKRVIPLVICFLPGLFVWPLGPFFIELLRIVDQLTARN